MKGDVTRGEIYRANLPDRGTHIQRGFRPVVVVSNNVGNKRSGIVIIAPITSRKKKSMPTHVDIKLDARSTILCEQLMTIHKSSLTQKMDYTLNEDDLVKLNQALEVSIGLTQIEGGTDEQL